MSLTITEFTHLVIVRSSQQTANALADHKLRESEHKTIEQQVQEFLKRGGNIEVVQPAGNVSTPMHISPMSQPDNEFLRIAVQNLRSSFGNNLDILIDQATGKYKAIYKGQQLGALKQTLSKAKAAIRCEGVKDRNNIKQSTMEATIAKYKNLEEQNKKKRKCKSMKALMRGVEL